MWYIVCYILQYNDVVDILCIIACMLTCHWVVPDLNSKQIIMKNIIYTYIYIYIYITTHAHG